MAHPTSASSTPGIPRRRSPSCSSGRKASMSQPTPSRTILHVYDTFDPFWADKKSCQVGWEGEYRGEFAEVRTVTDGPPYGVELGEACCLRVDAVAYYVGMHKYQQPLEGR